MKLSFEDEAIEAIADETLARKTGARGLRAIMEKSMMDLMYTIPSDETIEECTVTKEAIVGKGEPKLTRREDAPVRSKIKKVRKEIEETA